MPLGTILQTKHTQLTAVPLSRTMDVAPPQKLLRNYLKNVTECTEYKPSPDPDLIEYHWPCVKNSITATLWARLVSDL